MVCTVLLLPKIYPKTNSPFVNSDSPISNGTISNYSNVKKISYLVFILHLVSIINPQEFTWLKANVLEILRIVFNCHMEDQ